MINPQPTPAWIILPAEPTEAMWAAGMDAAALSGYRGLSKATIDYIFAAMVAARPSLTDAQVEAMCRAHYEAWRAANRSPAGGFYRWATWDQVCEPPGELDRRITAMRAALSALDRL